MKSKKLGTPRKKKTLKPLHESDKGIENSTKLSLFDHVKQIRSGKSPDYYENLSEENRKTFNHFMILRALAMDDEVVGEMAFLYRYFSIIPSAQFYQLLTDLVPTSSRWIPWVKTKVIKHTPEFLSLVAKHYDVSKRQANEYINVLTSTDEGLEKLVDLCQSMGLNESEIGKLFDKKEYE